MDCMRRSRADGAPLSRRAAAQGLAGSILLLGLMPAVLQASASVADFVDSLGREAIRRLTAADLSEDERQRRFRELLRKNFDLDRISRFVLGHHARTASRQEMERFRALYEDLMVQTYARMFASYSGETFEVRRATDDGKGRYAMVASEIDLAKGGDRVRLDWQVLTEGDRYAVVDLRVEGVSMAVSQRDEFKTVLADNSGRISGLLDELDRRVKALREEKAARQARP